MTILTSDGEVEQVATSVVATMISAMPFNSQSKEDSNAAEHYALKTLASKINSRLKKLDEQIKDQFKDGIIGVTSRTKNYVRTCNAGTPRRTFSKDAFIVELSNAFPDMPKHKIKEIADSDACYSLTAAPISIEYEYVGDLP